MVVLVTVASVFPLSGNRLRCCEGRFEDARIRAAAAEVSFTRFANFVERRVGILLQVRGDRGDEAGRAEAAHQRVVFDKRRLHRVRTFRRTETFDGGDLSVRRVYGEHETRVRRLAVEQDGTRATRAHVANELWTSDGGLEMIAQRVEQRRARLDLNIPRAAVNVERDPGVAGERRSFLCLGFRPGKVVGNRGARAGDAYA